MTTTTRKHRKWERTGETPTGSRDRVREARAQIDRNVEVLAKAVDAERASAEFRAYLDVQAVFHDYSWHNCMLIYSQRPDARRVAW